MYTQVQVTTGSFEFSQIPKEESKKIKSKLQTAISEIKKLQGRTNPEEDLLLSIVQ